MKNLTHLATYALITSLCLCSCKKSGSAPGNDTPPTGLSYQYNGNTYDGAGGNWGLIFKGTEATGISINRPDLFGGEVIFHNSDCAYLNTSSRLIILNNGCVLTTDDGSPVDASAVYIYRSGNFNSNSSNCNTWQKYDPWTDEHYSEQTCDIKGSFSLVLANNKGDKIEITNGSFGGKFIFR